jgi:toxin ParE1/3/4
MKLRYTAAALTDLDTIEDWQRRHWPTTHAAFESRLNAVHRHIMQFPMAASTVAKQPGLKVINLLPYPYRLFYRIVDGWIEVLHIRHVAQREFWEG